MAGNSFALFLEFLVNLLSPLLLLRILENSRLAWSSNVINSLFNLGSFINAIFELLHQFFFLLQKCLSLLLPLLLEFLAVPLSSGFVSLNGLNLVLQRFGPQNTGELLIVKHPVETLFDV